MGIVTLLRISETINMLVVLNLLGGMLHLRIGNSFYFNHVAEFSVVYNHGASKYLEGVEGGFYLLLLCSNRNTHSIMTNPTSQIEKPWNTLHLSIQQFTNVYFLNISRR